MAGAPSAPSLNRPRSLSIGTTIKTGKKHGHGVEVVACIVFFRVGSLVSARWPVNAFVKVLVPIVLERAIQGVPHAVTEHGFFSFARKQAPR